MAVLLGSPYFARVRALLALVVLALAACGRGEQAADTSHPPIAAAPSTHGADAFVLRVPRRGGTPQVSPFANLDSTVWTASSDAPALDRVIAFDDDAGQIAYVDARGLPGRIDLRLGTVTQAYRRPLQSLASYDASAIFGVGKDGAVVRLAPEGDWVFNPPSRARSVFPQSDGTLLVLADSGEHATLWRIHPPDTAILATAELPKVSRAASTQLADRVYVVSGTDALVGVRTRTLGADKPIKLGNPVAAIAATPSGDRVYVALESDSQLRVVDPYLNRVTGRIALPARASELRMDPFGRYLLARASSGDSIWVIALGTDKVIGSLRSSWRSDLPFVAVDGSIALERGADVQFVDGQTFRALRRVKGGAGDFWWAFTWNGFAPRAPGLDEPVRFPGDSVDSATSAQTAAADSLHQAAAPPADTATAPGYVVSFAAMLNQDRARATAGTITVEAQTARVVPTQTNGTTIYRVVLGPYATREQAERIGRESGKSYWIFQGAP